MNVQEFYVAIHGDYKDVISRLMNDRLVERFILKFPADTSYQQLLDAVAVGDKETAFRMAHTLKGVAANLSFRELFESASNLTESLRPGEGKQIEIDYALLEKVKEDYTKTIEGINRYKD